MLESYSPEGHRNVLRVVFLPLPAILGIILLMTMRAVHNYARLFFGLFVVLACIAHLSLIPSLHIC